MSNWSEGYDACLADIQVFIDQAYGPEQIAMPEDMRDFFENVTNLVKAKTKHETMYRGYKIIHDSTSASMYAGDEWIGTVSGPRFMENAKAEIDSYIEVRR